MKSQNLSSAVVTAKLFTPSDPSNVATHLNYLHCLFSQHGVTDRIKSVNNGAFTQKTYFIFVERGGYDLIPFC